MNINPRILSLLLLVLLLVPSFAFALSTATMQDRKDLLDEIEAIQSKAAAGELAIGGYHDLKEESLEAIAQADERLNEVMQEKNEVRAQIVEQEALAEEFSTRYGFDAENQEQLDEFYRVQKNAVFKYIKQYVRLREYQKNRKQAFGSSFLPQILGYSMTQDILATWRLRLLLRARIKMLALVKEIREVPQTLARLEMRHEELVTMMHAAADEKEDAEEKIALSDVQLAEIKRIEAEVEKKILALQKELAEYDERIRARAERELVARGLKAGVGIGTSGIPRFDWPIVGAITAGFLEASYKAYFGVPHKAIDIRAAQNTPVKAASEGIVYHVQHGGALGYSYILIGHRGGFATLYGHMYDIHVNTGQNISRGQIIGLSGGKPGTRGAGPMTTGPHLHFEVIKGGEHINPLEVLP